MKYRFITVMHNMELENIKNRGIKLFMNSRITNGQEILTETINTELMKATLGIHSINEFKNSTYIYMNGIFDEIENKEEMDKWGEKYTFAFLREVEFFLHKLWIIKDNNIYVRDGFLLVYKDDFEDGFTYKASVSTIFQKISFECKNTLFTDEELRHADLLFQEQNHNVKDFNVEEIDYKIPNDFLFYKKNKAKRIERATYFVMQGRASAIPPMRIIFYCIALECLFSSTKNEVVHKISERVACYFGTSFEEKKEIYKLIKQAYNIRSALVHGETLKEEKEELIEMTRKIDECFRYILREEPEIFNYNDNDLENYFIDLVLSTNTDCTFASE